MRYSFDGFFDRTARHGSIRCTNTPGNRAAIEKFNARRDRISRVGVWRKSPCSWKHNDGRYIDPEYYIVDWGQDG